MIVDLLRRSGVAVTAAPEFLVRQELLERMSDLLLKFIQRWQKTSTNPTWFLPEHRIHKHFRNGVHAFPLYKIAYPGVVAAQVQEADQYALVARALHLKPVPALLQANDFRVLAHVFWHLTIVLTDNNRVNTSGKAHDLGACYTSDPVNALSIPVYHSTQRFGVAGDAEANSEYRTKHISRDVVIHELRHAVQDYSGSHIWEISHLGPRTEENEGAGRDYYLRPNEVDARLAELIAHLRRGVADLVRSYQTEVSGYLKFVRLRREGADIPTMPGHKVTQEIVDAFRRSAVTKPAAARLRKIFAPGGDGFMAWCESVIKSKFPEFHQYLGDDIDDLAKSYATRHLHSELRELWADMQERYKNVIPTLKPELKPEPGEHFYQYGRPEGLR